MEKCAFCKQEPPTEKFYTTDMHEWEVCHKCNRKLIEAWEDEAQAIARNGEYLEVLLGLLKPEDLTEVQEN